MPKRAWTRPAFVALAFVFISPLAGAIDEREFACEEAYQHLEDCCGERPSLSCGTTCEPLDTNLAQADCLRRASCADLERAGACEDPIKAACK